MRLRILLTVPEVHGSSLLNDIRPIGLIELLRNAFFGIQYATIKDTWEDLELVSTTQYGAQRGIGTAEFRMMEVCIYETCYIYRLPVAKGNEDKRILRGRLMTDHRTLVGIKWGR